MENKDHKILALKYRPSNFNELIGQDAIVKTITNSVIQNKLPNAYLLTGIRGVGKTTTARLIAKAINCEKTFITNKSGEHCTCGSCNEIGKSKHLDVLEMDAASRTGIDDVRELIESSKYNPTSAKYKIYIIDEVHMLSKQAFNGLLKTLEEPPTHLKFILATTEVKKIPVTIISRCQRFDLHRVSVEILLNNLKKITKMENGKITEGALRLISKTAEGSVRDSLSLLDRAMVDQNITEKEIDEDSVRKMLGIADRSKILELVKFIFAADQNKTVNQLRQMIDEGIEPANFLNDLLEIIYFMLQKKSIGEIDSNLLIAESELETIGAISKDIKVSTLIIFWQFILKGLEELSIVGNPILSLEMLVIRLIYLRDMPSYEHLLNSLTNNNLTQTEQIEEKITIADNLKPDLDDKDKINKSSKEQIKNTIQIKPELNTSINKDLLRGKKIETILSFEDLIKISSQKKEIELKYDLERNVNLIKFSEGKVDIAFNENLSKNFVRVLSEKLLEWTEKRWVITLTKGEGKKTFLEQEFIKRKELIEKEKKEEIYKKFTDIFSDAELLEVLKKD